MEKFASFVFTKHRLCCTPGLATHLVAGQCPRPYPRRLLAEAGSAVQWLKLKPSFVMKYRLCCFISARGPVPLP